MHVHGTRNVRVHRRKHHRADIGQIEPQRELAPENSSMLSVAAARHDLHTSYPIGLSHMQKRPQCVEGLLRRQAMQVELAFTPELPPAKALPTC
jgi:hypothetical protein